MAFPELTGRERQVLSSIAQALGLSPKTVADYVSAIFTELQVADRAAAMVRAREAGPGT